MIVLVLGREQDREASLRETAPNVFQQVLFEQNTLSILKFKVVLHDERMAGHATNEPRFASLPDHGLEEMIPANFDVARSARGAASTKQNILARGFQEVVLDFVWPSRVVSAGTAKCLRIGA